MNGLLKFKYNYDSYQTDQINYDIKDLGYRKFLHEGHDGFYFSKSLHIYGLGKEQYHNVNKINEAFAESFDFLNRKYFCFACDVFGNQFCFVEQGIVLLNIETCEEEFLSKNFDDWTTKILSDHNYYSGESILLDWESVLSPIELNQRLVPRTPFIIGGEYSPKNMFAIDFITAINYNASIARQIYSIPDGTHVELKVGTPPTE